jgi:F0F1-type ATP synthase assembly protein I
MNFEKLKPIRPFLLISAISGFLIINVPFLYFALIEKETYSEAMSNGLALVFFGEAFLLMFFLAYIIAKIGWKKPGWVFFIAMSLLGSLAFSIPLQLYLITRPKQR